MILKTFAKRSPRSVGNGSLLRLGLTAASYVLLMSYDALALHHIRKTLPFRRVALASFTSYAFAHSFGFGSLMHATIRYRLYAPLGLRTVDIAEITASVNITFTIRLAVLFPVIALLHAPALVGSCAIRMMMVSALRRPPFSYTTSGTLMRSRRLGDEARVLFIDLLAHRNPFGLLSEDIPPETAALWGNIPQTYSMAGIINSAMRLSVRWEEDV